jgi:hypothetical protein
MPAAVLMATLIVAKLRNRAAGGLPFEFYGCLAVAAAVIIQPLGVSPTFPGFAHNEQRLVGIGLLPLVLAAAVALRYAQMNGRLALGRQGLAIVIAFLAIGSLHHIYTVIGPPNLKDFVALELVAAGIVGAVILSPVMSYLLPNAVVRHDVDGP